MGLGVGSIFTTLKLPLTSGQDPEWKDNTWLVESLINLARHISEHNPQIYRIGIEMDSQYKLPELKIEYFNK